MIPVVYAAPREYTSPRWCAAFAAGCGGRVEAGAVLRPGPVALFGSPHLWALLERARAEGRTWYYGDKAYFGRGRYFRITRNALQHDGSGAAGPDRFRIAGGAIAPWRRGGSHILVCPPGEPFQRRMGVEGWLETTLAALRRHTDRPIRIRLKPRIPERHPLAPDLVDCWALVTFMSNTAVEAICAGIPAFVTGRCAASAMAAGELARIEAPALPDGREQWAWNLAANQWTLGEMRAGRAWAALGERRAA